MSIFTAKPDAVAAPIIRRVGRESPTRLPRALPWFLGEHALAAQRFLSIPSDYWRRNCVLFSRENTHRTRLVLSNVGRKHTAGLDRGMAVCLEYPVEREG